MFVILFVNAVTSLYLYLYIVFLCLCNKQSSFSVSKLSFYSNKFRVTFGHFKIYISERNFLTREENYTAIIQLLLKQTLAGFNVSQRQKAKTPTDSYREKIRRAETASRRPQQWDRDQNALQQLEVFIFPFIHFSTDTIIIGLYTST